jgi:hypothetical protein
MSLLNLLMASNTYISNRPIVSTVSLSTTNWVIALCGNGYSTSNLTGYSTVWDVGDTLNISSSCDDTADDDSISNSTGAITVGASFDASSSSAQTGLTNLVSAINTQLTSMSNATFSGYGLNSCTSQWNSSSLRWELNFSFATWPTPSGSHITIGGVTYYSDIFWFDTQLYVTHLDGSYMYTNSEIWPYGGGTNSYSDTHS